MKGIRPFKVQNLKKTLRNTLGDNSPYFFAPTAIGFTETPQGKVFAAGFLILAAAALIRELKHQNKPIKVPSTIRTEDGKIKVYLENRGKTPLYTKPFIRASHTPSIEEKQRLGEMPMLSASGSNPQKTFELVGESEGSMLNLGETREYLIECSQNLEELDKQGFSVSVEYGSSETELNHHMTRDVSLKDYSKHPYLRNVGEKRAFILKKEHGEIIGEAFMLEGLLEAVESAPDESIAFHLASGNDFSGWVLQVVGDKKLAQRLDEVDARDISGARKHLSSSLRERIMDLEVGGFTGSHPNLSNVGEAYKFQLKQDHDEIIGEASYLAELRDIVGDSPTDAIIYHLRDDGNDFADWVQDVLGDRELADTLRKIELISPAQTKESILKTLDYRIKDLEGKY